MQMAGERGRFLSDAFHEIAIAANRVCMVIDDVVARAIEASGEPCLGDGHADAVSETLTKRAGGDFNTRRVAALGMARCLAAPLTEAFQFFERKVVTGEMQQAVK